MTIIDAHQHFWQLDTPFNYGWLDAPELAAIRRDRCPDDLAVHLKANAVDGTVVVQTQHDVAENRWALALAAEHPWIFGVVGWVDLLGPECADQLAEFCAHPKAVGVRHVIQDEPDDNFAVHPDTIRGLRAVAAAGLPFDLLFYQRHLPHAATLARLLPDLPLVLNHLSKPVMKPAADRAAAFAAWRSDFVAAAAFPNVYCKLSGLVTEADWHRWTVAELRPYIEVAVEAFGPSRCLFGSDWPVCELSATYTEVAGLLRECVQELSVSEQAEIWGNTAQRVYGLVLPG